MNIKRYVLNISTGAVHDIICNCAAYRRMAEKNKQFFVTYEEAENFFLGETKKGHPCNYCFPEKDR